MVSTDGKNTKLLTDLSQKTDEFKETYKRRASIEGKNAELKRFHGLGRAKRYGLVSMPKQAKLAAIMTAKASFF
ncbi:hypothetical protein Awo_c34220 [Acetobacterium woodii DSM 1030]|uniref:Transposase DDE domain-containing protein n=1 Tax=Acetobacterium woodii (strain ATCC 29683 / DSM 1030 / JCM 2381 / KCTC 1655 / WB1) TaxID=931626 RepID=H6LBM5_ACEWD|nr:hypothetical protein Awo_c34220 [Acetobacterium woodii DSM 1030]